VAIILPSVLKEIKGISIQQIFSSDKDYEGESRGKGRTYSNSS
jgi:hypothetical protein